MSKQQADIEMANTSRSDTERVVLHVIDAPFDGSKPQVHAALHMEHDFAEEMKCLPPHEAGTARILDVTVHSDFLITGLRDPKGPSTTRLARDEFIKFLRSTYLQSFDERRIFRWRDDPLPTNDIGSITSQWTQRLDGDKTNLYRLVNRSSLQQNPLDHGIHPRNSYLTCAQDGNDRLLAVIVNDVAAEQECHMDESGRYSISFENPRCTSSILAGTSWTSLADGTVENFAKLLILDFFVASIYLQRVDYFGSLIYPKVPERGVFKVSTIKNPHLQVPLGLFEPRLSSKSREAFQEIEDAEGILRSVNNLVDSIHIVLAALTPDIRAKQRQDGGLKRGHETRIRELEGLCRERCINSDRALNALVRQLDYLTKRHSIREAKSIKVLTILASLYLPLSLSSSLLGMQSPFKQIAHNRTDTDQDLTGTNLLFDFFGLFIWLSTATILIVNAIRLALWLKSNGLRLISKHLSGPFSIFHYKKRWRFDGVWGKVFEYIHIAAKWWICGGFCVTVSAIFWMGMLRTAQNAWDTAKWMFTAYCGLALLLVGSYCFLYFYLYAKLARRL